MRSQVERLHERVGDLSDTMNTINGSVQALPKGADFAAIRHDIGELKGIIGKLPTWQNVIWLFLVLGLVATLPQWPDVLRALRGALRG